jgi:serine/threonine protein kinase
MEQYHILERIGEGSFGKVYRGRRKYSGHIVALKFVTKRGKNAKELQNLREEVRRGLSISRLLYLQHKNCCSIWLYICVLFRSIFCGG